MTLYGELFYLIVMDNLTTEKLRLYKGLVTKAIENKSNSRKILFTSIQILPIWISFSEK